MKKIFFLILFSSLSIWGQIDTLNNQSNLESLLEDTSEGVDESNIYDILEFLTSNPIHLNTASVKDLQKIPFLNFGTSSAIIKHRNLLGGIYNVDQLRFIDGVSFELVEKILPFIKFGDEQPISFNEIFEDNLKLLKLSFRTRSILDLQEEEAFKDGTFPNSRWKLYNRLIVSHENKFRAGALIEKDPGEKRINDFTTFHFQMKELGFVNNLILGDFVFEFGQGLALWSRYAFSKGSDAVEVLPRNAGGLIPYLSSDENQFFRGIGAVTKFNNFTVSSFFSSRFLDASVDSASNLITALRIDGYHRTDSEIAKKDNINEKIFGATIEYNFESIGNLGFLFYKSGYSNNFEKSSLIEPSGNQFYYFSSSYDFVFKKLSFSGETALSKNSYATLNTLEFTADKNFSFLISYRNYAKDYWNIHSKGFGEKDFAQNETGFYTGIRLKTFYGTFNFYYDQYKFFYLSDKYPFSGNGTDFLIYYTFKPYKNSEVRVRYKNEKKEYPIFKNDVYNLTSSPIQNIRGEFLYSVFKNLQLRSRIEFVTVNIPEDQKPEKGYLIFQDVKYSPIENLTFTGRIIFFDTDSYNSRLYEFENDLTGVMTNPALFGDGMRWYFVVKYNSPYGLAFSLKYSELYKPSEKFLGSGYTQILGNLDNRISFQLDYQL